MSLPSPNLPRYDLVLPSNGKTIKYRPFMMKEEKLLLMAIEGGNEFDMVSAVHDVVHTCTDGAIDSNVNPMFDVQYAFLQIRAKSVSEVANFVIECGSCKARIDTSIDLTKVAVERVPGHTNRIDLTDTLGVLMRYPLIRHLDVLANHKEPTAIYRIIAECIETVFDGEEVHTTDNLQDVLEFVDTLTLGQFNKIQEFFRTMPVLRHEHPYTCAKCGKSSSIALEGIESFFV